MSITFLANALIWAQTVTPTPTVANRPIDNGNDPLFTVLFYIIFMLVAVGTIVVLSRIRFRQLERERAKRQGQK